MNRSAGKCIDVQQPVVVPRGVRAAGDFGRAKAGAGAFQCRRLGGQQVVQQLLCHVAEATQQRPQTLRVAA